MQTKNTPLSLVFTPRTAVLLVLRSANAPGMTAIAVQERLEEAGTPINRSALYRSLDELVGASLAVGGSNPDTSRRAPRKVWMLTDLGESHASEAVRGALRALTCERDATVEDHGRTALAFRAAFQQYWSSLASRINLREKVVVEEGTFTVTPGTMRATRQLEDVLRHHGLYEAASREKREIVMALVNQLAADHPELGEWIDARRAELAGERHLKFTAARKGEPRDVRAG